MSNVQEYSRMISTLSPAASKFLGRPARRCARCGGSEFSVNPAGALACCNCVPSSQGCELSAECDATGRMVWAATAGGAGAGGGVREPGTEADEVGGGNPFAALGGVACGAVASPGTLFAASSAVDSSDWSYSAPKPYSVGQDGRVDPAAETADALVFVSTGLDWFFAPRGGFWDRKSVVIDPPSGKGSNDRLPPPGTYRPLSQPFFAWLVNRVDAIQKQAGEQNIGRVELDEIAGAGFACGVLGSWVLDRDRWPRVPPLGYVGPVPSRPTVDWDRGVVPWDDSFDRMQERLAAMGREEREHRVKKEKLERAF